MAARGTLILVVGASGAGKDTLIAGARERLVGDPAFVFPRRFITRPAGSPGEDHIAVDVPTFEKMRAASAFALAWQAHGLCYGVPASIAGDLAAGRHVVVNVSRGVVSAAREQYHPVLAVLVTACAATLATRLAERDREAPQEIAARLVRAGAVQALGAVHELANDGTVAEGVDALLRILETAPRFNPKG